MKQPNPPTLAKPRIVIESLEVKKQLIEISELTGETLKDVVVRLVNGEYEKRCK
jgi:hypothetical protein